MLYCPPFRRGEGGGYFQDLLRTIKVYHYFLGVPTFEESLTLELKYARSSHSQTQFFSSSHQNRSSGCLEEV